MSQKHSQRWAYGLSAVIFFLVAAINAGMIISDGPTTFRIIAAAAFAMGGILLIVKFSQIRRPSS